MIEIQNLTAFAVDKTFFRGVAKKILKGENRETENVSVVFVAPTVMRKLNNEYRKKNKATDVLSFTSEEKFPGESSEVVICPSVVKKNAQADKTAFEEELLKVFIHGMLHILGYDHEVSKKAEIEMNQKQAYYLKKAK